MSIATEKLNFASERFLLVRMNPARYVEPASIGGGLYTITLPFICNKLERNGTVLTKKTTVGAVSSNDDWFQDESTLLLTVKLASAPSATTNVLIAYHYLFYTGTINRAISENPEDSSTSLRNWDPRLSNYPTILKSIDNITAGIFTISDTNINIINEDKHLQQWLTANDSFNGKEVIVWLCIGDVSNIQRIFDGKITELQLTRNEVSFTAADQFNALQRTALMGDDPDYVVMSRSLNYPDLNPADEGKTLPYVFGSSSRYSLNESISVVSAPNVYRLNKDGMNEASNIDYNTSNSPNNSLWICNRQEGDLISVTPGLVSARHLLTGSTYAVMVADITNLKIGDTVRWISGGTKYGYVAYVGAFTYSAVNYNLIITDATGDPNAQTFISTPSFGVVYDDNNRGSAWPTHMFYGHNYTATASVQDSNYKVEITLLGTDTVDPALDKIYYRTSNQVQDTHAEALQRICELCGLTIDATSFTAADSALNSKVRFQIPQFDETESDQYLKYAELILGSTLGYLKINTNNEVEYHLVTSASGGDTKDENTMLEGDTASRVDYQDIARQVILYNAHMSDQLSVSDTSGPSQTVDNSKTRYLHASDNVDRVRHVLEKMGVRKTAHAAIRAYPKVRYNYSTATEDVDTEIGQSILIDNQIMPSDAGDVVVTSVEKSIGKISIETIDIRGF